MRSQTHCGLVAALLLALASLPAPALADETEGCERIGMAAGWTIFAGFGSDVTPQAVIEITAETGGANLFKGLVWSDDRVLDMINQIIESDFEIDRTEGGMRRSTLFGAYFRLQCESESRGITFRRLPDVKSVIQNCIDTGSMNKQAYELCLLDGTVNEDSWENYTGPGQESESA